MQFSHLRRCHPMDGAYVDQVGAVVSAIAHGDFHAARLWQSHVLQSREILLQNFFEFVVSPLQGIELHQHGAICGMKVADACDGFQRKQLQEFSDVFVGTQGDLLAEVNE